MSNVRVVLMSTQYIPDEMIRLAGQLVERPHSETHLLTNYGQQWSIQGELADMTRGRMMLQRSTAAHPIDAAIIPAPLSERPPRLLMMDVDSTLTTSEAIDELAEAAGRKDEVAEITNRAMRGEIDFAESLRARVATLEGLPTTVFADVVNRTEFSCGAQDMIRRARSTGCRIALVSGGFIEIVKPLVQSLGIDDITANGLETREGRLTGHLHGPVIDRTAKRQHLQRNAAQIGCQLSEVVAVGDGANDLDMLDAAGLGIAYCAKPVVAAQADATISFPRLDAVCGYLQF